MIPSSVASVHQDLGASVTGRDRTSGRAWFRRRPTPAAMTKRGCTMTTDQNEMVLRSLNALRLSRRRLVGTAAATAVALPAAAFVPSQGAGATPQRSVRAQG